ncbi:MAG: polyphosphate polymerase domain-containing protein [Candidatus Saccharibacteria bacterium]|nr:polyphosphate polymerase domain-containing protein [Candidatus Saccharibacteria bacterium]
MDTKVFDRIEKKYLIDAAQKKHLLMLLKTKMKKDKYFHSEIFNLYFDTEKYDLIIKSIENPDFKEKLRARSYGGYDKVFMEIKTKMKGAENRVGHKRRFLITHHDFQKLVRGEKRAVELASLKIEEGTDLQIAKEVDYLLDYFALKPRILVYYDRESYISDDGLRITFDENLKYRDKDLNFIQKVRDKRYFDDNKIIMEVKANGVMPLWLVKKLSEEKIFPSRFSKIGKIYEKIRKEQ